MHPFISLQEIRHFEEEESKISIESIYFFNLDFSILKVLGKGAYGKVYLVRRKETKDLYALKIIAISEDVSEKEL